MCAEVVPGVVTLLPEGRLCRWQGRKLSSGLPYPNNLLTLWLRLSWPPCAAPCSLGSVSRQRPSASGGTPILTIRPASELSRQMWKPEVRYPLCPSATHASAISHCDTRLRGWHFLTPRLRKAVCWLQTRWAPSSSVSSFKSLTRCPPSTRQRRRSCR